MHGYMVICMVTRSIYSQLKQLSLVNHLRLSKVISLLAQTTLFIPITVKHPNKGHIGDNIIQLFVSSVERLSSSPRFKCMYT